MQEAPPHLDDGEWFHGSPLELNTLAIGSAVTRCRAVAEAFAHRPTWVSIGDAGGKLDITHDGALPGFLYVANETIGEDDLHPHPNSSFPGGGLEWITDRPLRLRLLARMPAR